MLQRWIVVPLAALVLGLGACGSDDEGGGDSGGSSGGGSSESSGGGGGGGGGQTLTLAADAGGALEWDKTELTATAGPVVIELDNPASIPHAVTIEGNGVDASSDEVTGGKATVEADLEAGTYEYYCPVGTHATSMKGTLTVE